MVQDVRYAWRRIIAAPVFSAAVVATVALGVGANAAVFAVVQAALFRPLPYPQADRVLIGGSLAPGVFLDWTRRSSSFTALAAYTSASFDIGGAGTTERVDGAIVSGAFFDVAGVAAARGRTLTHADAAIGERVLVLSDALWRHSFRADPAITGRSILVNGEKFTIIGVMPSGFRFPFQVGAWIPARHIVPRTSIATVRESVGSAILALSRSRRSSPAWRHLTQCAAGAARDLREHPASVSRRGEERRRRHQVDAAPGLVDRRYQSSARHSRGCRVTGIRGRLPESRDTRPRGISGAPARDGNPRCPGRRGLAHRSSAADRERPARRVWWCAGGASCMVDAARHRPHAARGAPRVRSGDRRTCLALRVGPSIFAGVVFGLAPLPATKRQPSSGLLAGGRATEGRAARRTWDSLIALQFAVAFAVIAAAALLYSSLAQLMSTNVGFVARTCRRPGSTCRRRGIATRRRGHSSSIAC